MSKIHHFLVAAALVCTASGCAALRGRTLHGPPYAAVYTDPQPCDDPYEGPSLAVAQVMCGAEVDTEGVTIDPEQDVLVPAALVAVCAASNRCDPADPYGQPTQLAWAWDMSMRIDAGMVEAALAKSAVPGFMQQDFLGRYRAATERIHERVASLGPHWRDVFLKPMLTARADRAAADEVLAPWIEQTSTFVTRADKALLAGEPDAKLVDDALAMRRHYVDACMKARHVLERCLGDTVGNALTGVIHRLAAARKDGTLEAAEANIRRLPDYSDPKTDEWMAVHEAFEAERARYSEYAKARDAGVSEAALAERWPEVPLEIGDQDVVLGVAPADREGADYDAADVDVIEEEVRVVKHSGKKATVLFKKNVYRGSYATGCHETGRVDGIDEYGHLIYREVCTGPDKSYTEDNTTKPVTVPWIEVAHVKGKEVIHVVVDRKTRTGHVSYVMAPRAKDDSYGETARVQLREWRL